MTNAVDLLQKWAEDWQIQFNLKLTKCDFLRITKRKCPIAASYTIGKVSRCYLYWSTPNCLGMNVSLQKSQCCLYQNISSCAGSNLTVIKAYSQDNFRICSNGLGTTHLKLYNMYILKTYNTRFMCSDYFRYSSVTEMLQSLSLPTLNQHQDTAKVVFMHKILHWVVDACLTSIN